MKLPVPTARTLSVVAWCAVAVSVAVVVFLVFVSTKSVLDSNEKDHQIDALLEQIEHNSDAAAQERRRAARNQTALLNYTKELADRQADLLDYLHRHGIEIPQRFLTGVRAPRIVDPATGQPVPRDRSRHHNTAPDPKNHGPSTGGKNHGPSGGHHAPGGGKTSGGGHHGGGGPTSSSPGHSGSAPGHVKHHPHGGGGKKPAAGHGRGHGRGHSHHHHGR